MHARKGVPHSHAPPTNLGARNACFRASFFGIVSPASCDFDGLAEPRLRELEQQLAYFLTKNGLIVSLIRARHPTRAQALLHRQLPGGELSKVKIDFDLKPYLENFATRDQ